MVVGFSSGKTLGNVTEATKKLSEATKRLSSGYRINSAADDAAGLAVSEKLRSIDRGLRQGIRNLSDGLNYIDTVDGCTQTINDTLHRLKELAVQSANGTYSELERASMDLEYQQLLDEINQITDTSQFNTIPLYDKHMPVYTFMPGNVVHDEAVVIDSSNDTLVVDYSIDGETRNMTISIPHGTYSADVLADELDDYLFDAEPGLIIGVNDKNQFTLQSENGHIESISGTGATLFYDIRIGSHSGYLMGMTKFQDDTKELIIRKGLNDTFEFRLGNADDQIYKITLNSTPRPNSAVKDGRGYNRPELIKEINDQFKAAGLGDTVKAVPDKNHEGELVISLWGEKPFTGLKGNFLMIDGEKSPIFDICKYATLKNETAWLDAKKNIRTGVEIVKGRNDWFDLNVKYYDGDVKDKTPITKTVRVNLLPENTDGDENYTAQQIVDKIQKTFDDNKIPIEVFMEDDGTFKIESKQYGRECEIKLDTKNVPSVHMVYDLFNEAVVRRVKPTPSKSSFSSAKFYSQQDLSKGAVINDKNNILSFNITTEDDAGSQSTQILELELDYSSYGSADSIITALNQKLAESNCDVKDLLKFELSNNKIVLKGDKNGDEIPTKKLVKISEVPSCSAYHTLIKAERYNENLDTYQGQTIDNYIVSKPNTAPNSQSPNITYSPGSSAGGHSTVNGRITSEKYETGDYMKYDKNSVSITRKKGEGGNAYDDYVGNEEGATPATMTIGGIGTQFFGPGDTSKEKLNFHFGLSNSFGDISYYDLEFPEGSTFDSCINKINHDLGDVVQAVRSGNSLVLTSKAKGAFVEFSEGASGSFINGAVRNSAATGNNVDIDKANNTFTKYATTILHDAGTNFSGDGFTVNEFNNILTIAYGDSSKTIELDTREEPYTDFSDFVEKQIKPELSGTGISVSTNGNELIFSAKPNTISEIKVYGNSGLDKKKTNVWQSDKPASLTISGAGTKFSSNHQDNNIVLNNSNNTITMKYRSPVRDEHGTITGNKTETLTIKLDPNMPNKANTWDGTIDSFNELYNAIRDVISKDTNLKDKISVSGSGNALTFTTKDEGEDYLLSDFSTTLPITTTYEPKPTPPNADDSEIDIQHNVYKSNSSMVNDKFNTLFTNDGLLIDDTNCKFSFSVGGTPVNITIPKSNNSSGRYTSMQTLVDNINTELAKTSVGGTVKAKLDGNTFKIVTLSPRIGSGNNLKLNSDNKAPLFCSKEVTADPYNIPQVDSRCRLTGTLLIKEPTEIGTWNNKMTFDYTNDDGNTTTGIEIAITPKTYANAEELADEIEDKIAEKIGENHLDVSVVNNRLQISASNHSKKSAIANFEGRLFDKVFQGPYYNVEKVYKEKVGTTEGGKYTYIFGNNPMEPHNQVEIESGKNVQIELKVNDEFKFDFTYNGQHEIAVQIPEGVYTNEELAATLQSLIRNEIVKINDYDGEPIEPERFKVVIGLDALGINITDEIKMDTSDKLVLCFQEYEDGSVHNTDVLINGIRGSSAYKVFYETTKTPAPTIVIGNADLSNGVNIIPGKNDSFGFTLDGEEVMIPISGGYYTSDGIIEYLNDKLAEMDSVVRVYPTKDQHLMLYTLEEGDYNLEKIKGGAANDLFYGGSERDEDEEGPGIHTGRRTDTYIWMNKTRLDAHLMRINTTGVSTPKRAAKAMERLEYANNYLLHYRAQHGAYENRIERALGRNTSQTENLTAAESGIRDTDVPTEFSNSTRQSIITQMQNFILKQEQEFARNSTASIMDQLG